MRKVKFYGCMILVMVVLVSTLCSCSADKVKVDKEDAEVVEGFFEALEMTSNKAASAYLYMPDKGSEDFSEKTYTEQIRALKGHLAWVFNFSEFETITIEMGSYTEYYLQETEQEDLECCVVAFQTENAGEECEVSVEIWTDAVSSGIARVYVDDFPIYDILSFKDVY